MVKHVLSWAGSVMPAQLGFLVATQVLKELHSVFCAHAVNSLQQWPVTQSAHCCDTPWS